MEAKVNELEEIKRYLLSEISLEKETHSQTLAQVESLKLQLAEFEQVKEQLADTEEQLRDTQVALLSKDKKLRFMENKVKELQATQGSNSNLSNNNVDAQVASNAALVQAQRKIVELEQQLNVLQSNDQQQAGMAPQADYDLLKAQVNELETKLNQRNASATTTVSNNSNADVDQLKRDADRKAADNARLERQLAAFKQKAGEDARRSQQKIVGLEKELERKTKSLSQLQSSIEAFQSVKVNNNVDVNELNKKNHEIQQLQQEIADVRAELQSERTKYDALQGRYRALSDDMQRLSAQHQQQLAHVQTEWNNATAALQTEQRDRERLNAELAAAQRRAMDAEARLAQIAASNAAATSADASIIQSQLAAAQQAERFAQQQVANQQAQLTELQNNMARASEQAERERKALRLAHIRAMKQQIDELRNIVSTQQLFEKRLVAVL